MKIACWNVNSLRARLEHVTRWLEEESPDALLLQETKCKDENFPARELAECGYQSAFYGQPSYNGVAICAKTAPQDVVCGNPHRSGDPQARIIAATVGGVRLLSVYVPNGSRIGSEKFAYKMEWLEDFSIYLRALADGVTVAGGDYNIAPADDDVYDPADWGEEILTSPPERAALARLLERGYADAHRLFEQPSESFTWWDYRAAAFRRNRGLRIDLMLLSAAARERATTCVPHPAPRGWERPSDHTPVVLELAD